MQNVRQGLFRGVWWSTNVLLLAALVSLIYAGGWEYSVRRYLDGFSDAIVADSVPAERQAQAILDWMMRSGPARTMAADPATLPTRDPEATLNYRQLLTVCGTATNAFLNLARSNGLSVRRLLLLNSDGQASHVVAEVLIDARWVIADPTYHVLLRDARGNLLTRSQLRDPVVFAEATKGIPGYRPEYNYAHFAHVRLSRIPMGGVPLRAFLDLVFPKWEETVDWTLLLERESFFALSLAAVATFLFLLLRVFLAWYADHRLMIPRFRLRAGFLRARSTFLRAPEIK